MMEKLIARINQIGTEQLKDVAAMAAVRMDEESGIVFNVALDVLMDRMDETDFCAFTAHCEYLMDKAA